MSKLDGRAKLGNLKLVLNWNTLCELEALWGLKNMGEVEQALGNVGESPGRLRGFLYAALLEDQPDISERDAGRMISEYGVEEIGASLEALVNSATPDESDEPSAVGNVKKRATGKSKKS